MENISLIVAFGAGLLSFLSPCVLPLVPVYLANLVGPDIFVSEAYERHTPSSVAPLLKRIHRYSTAIYIFSGALLMAVGVLILINKLVWFS